jgi:hypothetical protein
MGQYKLVYKLVQRVPIVILTVVKSRVFTVASSQGFVTCITRGRALGVIVTGDDHRRGLAEYLPHFPYTSKHAQEWG